MSVDRWHGPTFSRRVRFVRFRCLLGGVALAALTGCGGGGDGDGDPIALTTTSAEATTTTAPTTSTTVDFETEVKLAAIELLELRNEVFMAPDVTRVDEYISQTCVCREAELGFIRDLETAGARWTEPAFEVLGIRIDDPNPAEVLMMVVARQPGGTVSDGATTTSIIEVPVAPLVVSLVREDGEWRINGLDEFPLPAEAANQIVEQGVP